MDSACLEKVETLVKSCCCQLDVDCVDFDVKRRRDSFVIDILADRPKGGITLGECAVLNRRITEILDIEEIMSDEYNVEVSSPGLDRPLITKEDFQRVINRWVQVYLNERIKSKMEYKGCIQEALKTSLKLKVGYEIIEIDFDKINRAVQVIA